MTDQEQKSVMTLVLMAAFADGKNDPAERAEVARITRTLADGADFDVTAVHRDVLLERVTLDDAAGMLVKPQVKRLAYELCVGMCDVDGLQSEPEKAFLASLRKSLGFNAEEEASAQAFTASAEALAVAPLATVTAAEPAALSSTMSADEQDRVILNYAILNGALEILPDSLASMAILPLQMKMVYRIGKSYGFELDRGHIKEFLATAGVGLVSQYVEQIGVKLVGKVFGGGLIGGLLGGVAKQTVSSGFSFATTYALGRLAVRHYAGGRTFSTQVLKDTYASLLTEAKGLQARNMPAIREKAR
ncbi:MAG: hypothetical protein Q7V01_04460, partial [Vicinamibacterales bacterium]|nr:hypothetical protein [Vicinamibacterales bacterium]